MELRLVPFVRIKTWWSDDSKPTETGHIEEWFALMALLLYGDASLWRNGQVRPVRAILVDRVWTHDVAGPLQ